jgi:hypothetical protein
MVIKVEVEGLRRLKAKCDKVDKNVREAAYLWLTDVGRVLVDEARRLVKMPPKSGRMYRRYNPERFHQSSAPGQPPAYDRGALSASMFSEIDRRKLEAYVASSSPVAIWMEYGTRKMMPRPFMRRAIMNKERSITQLLSNRLKRMLLK